MTRYDWPPVEGVVALVKEHGQNEAARMLGVPRPTLASFLDRNDIPREDRVQHRAVNDEALKEIARLLDGS